MDKIKVLIAKEIRLELRRKAVISGLCLYLFSSVFIGYLALGQSHAHLSPMVWSALFWITSLFTVVNTIAKSFIGEKKGTEIYLYSIANPTDILFSKIIYNCFLTTSLAWVGYGLFSVLLSNPIQDLPLFMVLLTLTSCGFSASLTLLSAVSSKANHSHILMAVLSFPVVIGLLVMSIKVTKNCIDGLDRSTSYDELLTLLSINFLVASVSYFLFPYIWRS